MNDDQEAAQIVIVKQMAADRKHVFKEEKQCSECSAIVLGDDVFCRLCGRTFVSAV